MHCWTANVVGSFDVAVDYVGYKHCRGLVHTLFGEAVELIDDDWVPNVVHVKITECHSRYSS